MLRTLARWSHPNTKANRHAILTSFYAWMVRRGHRKDNPADRIERARKRKADPLRMRRDEALAVLSACETTRERRVVYLALLEGVRNQELRRLKGRHFDRPGLIRIAPEVAKGGRPRWLPVLEEAQPVVDEICANVARDDHVVPAQRRDPNRGIWFDLPDRQCSGQAVWRLVRRVAERAGVESTPHALRRAFADLIDQHADVRVAQRLLGHTSLATTELYLSDPTLDSLQAAVIDAALGPTAPAKNVIPLPTSVANRTPKSSTSTSTASFYLFPPGGRGTQTGPQTQKYRHGDSNPGFRRERAAS